MTALNNQIDSINRARASGIQVTHLISAATTNATNVTSASTFTKHRLYGYAAFNNHASAVRYLKIYGLSTTSAPTVGTDVPKFTILLPFGGGANIYFDEGLWLGNGYIGMALTTGIAIADTAAVGAGECSVSLLWA